MTKEEAERWVSAHLPQKKTTHKSYDGRGNTWSLEVFQIGPDLMAIRRCNGFICSKLGSKPKDYGPFNVEKKVRTVEEITYEEVE